MKIKNVMLVTLLLLAVLMIGAVSAADDIISDEGLAVSNDGDALGEMTPDDISINVEDIDTNEPGHNFTEISVSEKEGNFVICTGEDEGTVELYRDNLAESDSYYEDDGKYCFGVSFDDVNNYIGVDSDFYDIVKDNSIRFVLEYQDSDFIVRTYEVDFDENIIHLNERTITADNLYPWVQNHQSFDNSESDIVNVHLDDNVCEGTIVLNVTASGVSKSYEKGVDEANEYNDVIWRLDELDIIGELGTYAIDVAYVNGDVRFDLVNDFYFTLTRYDYGTHEGNVFIADPFDIITIWSEDVDVEVYVNDALQANGGDDPLRWTLSDLNITDAGDYTIRIVAYEDGSFVEEITYDLYVDDDIDGFRLISPPFGVHSWDFDNPILYLISPQDKIGENVILVMNGEESDLEITSDWMSWTLEDFGIEENDGFDIRILEGSDEVASTYFDVWDFSSGDEDPLDFDVWNDDEILYTDYSDRLIAVYSKWDVSGMLYLFVNDEEKFKTIVSPDKSYEWNLPQLGIAQPGDYNIKLTFLGDDDVEIDNEYVFKVREFENDTFRARVIELYDDGIEYLYFFSPANQTGTVTLNFKYWDDELEDHVYTDTRTFNLNETHWNRWNVLTEMLDEGVDVKVNDTEIGVEYYWEYDGGNFFEINEMELHSGDVALWVYANVTDNNYTISVTSGDYKFFKNVTELGGDYEWEYGLYKYCIYLDDLDSFSTLNDKDKVMIFMDVGGSLSARWLPYSTYSLEKDDDFVRLHFYEELRVDLVKIELVGFEEDEEDEDEDSPDDEPEEDIPQEEIRFVRVTVPDSLNITQTGQIHIIYGDYDLTRDLSDFDYEYNYECLGRDYYILWGDLNLENLQNNDVVNITVASDDEILGSCRFAVQFGDEGWEVDYFLESIGLTFYYGQIGNLEFGMDGDPDRIIELSVPEYLNVTDGAIIITDENGDVIFSKSLSEFDENHISYDFQNYEYWISDNITEFDYSCFKENVTFTVSFDYGNTTTIFARGVRQGNELHRINTPMLVSRFYKITVSDNVLVNDSDNVIVIEATDDANRQSVAIDLGGGYFAVYVNGKKVEDLGRLVRVDDEKELELFRLSGGSRDGSTKLYIYLSDLNITDNGFYNVKVTHRTGDYDDSGTTAILYEVELFNKNVTLTSNLKVNYQNATTELFTGYGMNPVLMYLDTYYGDIDDVTGKITVFNSNGNQIFTSDITKLSSSNDRYYLSYSDFEDDFGDRITVVYSDGNERSGETVLDVLWRNITSEDFSPELNNNVSDYYGNILDLIIPDNLNEGQITVTIKFNNNYSPEIANMNVTADYGSQATYIFNVADIKANYPANNFGLSLNDLGFYEENGNYSINAKFTAGGGNELEILNSNVNVELSDDILIGINEISRYGLSLEFSDIKSFKPISGYAVLYIDGDFYSNKTFKKGEVRFDSSSRWDAGEHTAEIKVYSDRGAFLANSTQKFETLVSTNDVELSVDADVGDGKNVVVSMSVPKDGEAMIQIDNGQKVTYSVVEGSNSIDLGVLNHGNHTIWVCYEVELEDGNISFYNGYLKVSVGDDSWLIMPRPVVLEYDDAVKINIGNATGYVLVMIDGKLYANVTLINGSGEISLSDLPYGVHNYTFIYSGDGSHDGFSENGTFRVTYLFEDNLNEEEYPLQELYTLIVRVPDDAAGTVTINVDGKNYTADVKDGKAIFALENLTIGEYDIDIAYSGDGKYPPMNYNKLLNISYYGVVGVLDDAGAVLFVSLMLPANATGNLVVVNGYDELYSVGLENGKAKVDLSRLTVGVYNIKAYYNAADYEVRQFAKAFKIMPEVNITEELVIGDVGEISMDLANSTGYILILFDGLNPELKEIVDGKIIHDFKTDNFTKGIHAITFQYFGTSFDGNIFYNLNEKTGRYEPVEYYFNMLPLQASVTTNSDSDEWLIIDCGDATGTIEVFVDGVKYAVVSIVDGVAKIDISQFKDGNYKFTFKYSGDSVYDEFTREMLVNVNHKFASVAANDLNMIYTSAEKYSVVVLTKEGKLASGVTVDFLIDNVAYGSAVADLNGVASISISKAPGLYKITSVALGASATKTLNVNHLLTLKTVKVKRSAKKLVLTATLKKVNGKYLKAKKVTFKFNGKTYKVKTNKKGVAKLTIKSGALKKLKAGKKVTYQATYLKDTVKKTVKVKK